MNQQLNQIPNPYAPPAAPVADLEDRAGSGMAPFVSVGLFKFAVMSLVTFGFYEVFWFYWNWRLVRARTGAKITPVARAIFAIIFCYPFFAEVKKYSAQSAQLAAGPLAAGWIVTSLLFKLPEPAFLLSLLAFVFALPVQAQINRINAEVAPEAPRNERFSGLNWVGIVLGGLLLVLSIIGSFVPE